MEKDAKTAYNMLLRNARLEKGWTQQKLAEMITEELADEKEEITIDEQSVGRWERRRVFPSPEVLPAICKVFGKKSEELGLLWELYHPVDGGKKPEAKQEEPDIVLPPLPQQDVPTALDDGSIVHQHLRSPNKPTILITRIAIVAVIVFALATGIFVYVSNKPSFPKPTLAATVVTTATAAISPCAAAPILVDPVDGLTLNSLAVTFTWEAPRGCLPDGYTVRITANYDPEAKPWIVDTGWAPTFYKYTFSADGTYYLHIRACKPCTPFNPGAWAIRTFTIHTS